MPNNPESKIPSNYKLCFDGIRMTTSDGQEFERQTAAILNLFPGSSIDTQVELVGKKVDNLCTLPGHLIPRFRIVVECKDWERPLTRKDCAQMIADYSPILDGRLADQFLLVTKSGIVPNAKKLFDDRRNQHLRFTELVDKVLDPTPLVENMSRQFSNDGLNDYYIQQSGFTPDLETVSQQYDLIYNDFIDFALDLAAEFVASRIANSDESNVVHQYD